MNKLALMVFCVVALFVACTTPQKTTRAWTPWVGPVTNATQMAELLRLRWPLEVVHDYCRTNQPITGAFAKGMRRDWKGQLYTNSNELSVSWSADAVEGRLSEYVVSARMGTTIWYLEGGPEAKLALPITSSLPFKRVDRRVYKAWLRSDGKKRATSTWTPWVETVTNAAQMGAILSSRWTTNTILNYCQTNAPTPRGLQSLIYTKHVWKGELHTNSVEPKKIYWYADVQEGRVYGYSVNAVAGTNWWVLETGDEAQLAYPIGIQPTPIEEFKKIFRGWVGKEYDSTVGESDE